MIVTFTRTGESTRTGERLVAIACGIWKKDPRVPKPENFISREDLERICIRFDEVSGVWSKLKVGESMQLVCEPAKHKKWGAA